MRRALKVEDIKAAHVGGQPIIVQAVEGALFVEGQGERVEVAYKRGLRSLQLIHDRESGTVLGDSVTGLDHDVGLTPFGAEIIKECNRLGMLVDLAHGTPRTLAGAVKASGKPIIISHAGMLVDFPRGDYPPVWRRALYTNDEAKVVTEAGGVVGVWWRLFNHLSDYVAAIRARVEVLGVEHVGIGTDSDITSSDILPYSNKVWMDQSQGFFFAVVTEMLRQGFTAQEIEKIGGGNYLRVFALATAGHTA
jgi:membrane dipeptidase